MIHLRNLVCLLIFTSVLFGFGIGRRDLWAPDEPRFGQAAREMLQRRDPFVLHVNGEPYADKPPLHIWIAALVDGGDGSTVSPAAVRLPSVLGGVFGVAAIYALAALLFGSARIALIAGIVTSTIFMIAYQANRAQLDMLMSGFSWVATLCFWLAWRDRERPPARRLAWWGLFWIAGGLATLSKGPPGAIVPLGTAAFFIMWQRDPRRTLWTAAAWAGSIFVLTLLAGWGLIGGGVLLTLAGLVLAVLLAGSVRLWLWPLWRESPARLLRGLALFAAGLCLFAAVVGVWFIPYRMNAPKSTSQDTLVTQTLTRYLAGVGSHEEPPWFFVERLPYNLLPWLFFMASAIWFAWRRQTRMRPQPRRFLTSWILFTVVFFTLSPGKRDQYLLPCLPAFGVFAAWFFDVALRSKPDRFRWSLIVQTYLNAFVAAVVALGALIFHWLFIRPELAAESWRGSLMAQVPSEVNLGNLPLNAAALVAVVLGVVLYMAARRRRVWAIIWGSAALMTFIQVFAGGWVLPAIDPVKSPRSLTRQIAEHRRNNEPVGIYNVMRAEYILHADYFLTFIERDGENGDPELHAFMQRAERVFVIMREKRLEGLMEKYPELRIRPLVRDQVGSRELVVVDNQGPVVPSSARREGAQGG